MPEETHREISSDNRLELARQQVLDWLRGANDGEGFRAEEAASDVQAVIQRFLHCTSMAGFGWQVVEIHAEDKVAYEVQWIHQGATFAGFKQPPAENSPEDALLAGCAALLQNQWCRGRL